MSRGSSNAAWRSRAWAALLLAPAVLLRFHRLDWMEFGNDEEMFMVRGFRAFHEGVLWGSSSSIGLRLPPFFAYLLGLPMLITREPVHLAAFIGALNVAALGLLFVFVRGFLGPRVAFWTTALMAYSPWAVVYSRKIWSVDAIFPLVVATLLVVTSHARGPRRWKVVAGLAMVAALSQVHPSAWFLVVPLVLFHILLRIRVRAVDLLLGLGAACLLYLPYLVYLLRTGFDNVLFALNVIGTTEGAATPVGPLFLSHAANVVDLSTGRGFEHALGPGAWEGFVADPLASALAALPHGLFPLAVVATLAAMLVALRAIASGLRGREVTDAARGITLLSLVLVAGLVYLAASGSEANPHYAVVFYPAVSVFLTWGLDRVLAGLRAPPALGTAVVAAVVLAQGLFLQRFMAWQRTNPPSTGGVLAAPFAPNEPAWRALLATEFDEILHGEARTREEQARLERWFESCEDVLLRWDPARNEPPVTARGKTEIVPQGDGVLVRRGTAVDMACLPPFEVPEGRSALLRLELEVPDDSRLNLFYLTRDDPQYSGRNHRYVQLRRGRNTLVVVLDAPGVQGSVLLRPFLYRWVLRSLEVRAGGS